jgi:predicted dehydrogenase
MYNCAIIGVSGGRARGHAEAYQYIRRGELVAISSRQREGLDAFGERFGITARYTDYREMRPKSLT